MENRITEQASAYDNLQRMSVHDILTGINREDARVHEAVAKTIPVMERLVERVVERMERAGRMFTSGPVRAGRLVTGRLGASPDLWRALRQGHRPDRRRRRCTAACRGECRGRYRRGLARHGALPSHGGRCPGRDRAASGTTPGVVGRPAYGVEHGLLTSIGFP